MRREAASNQLGRDLRALGDGRPLTGENEARARWIAILWMEQDAMMLLLSARDELGETLRNTFPLAPSAPSLLNEGIA